MNYDELYDDIQAKGSDHPDIVERMDNMTNDEVDQYTLFEIRREGGEAEMVELWYQRGHGYHPLLAKSTNTDTSHNHIFYKGPNDTWYQLSGPNIQGLDGNSGVLLLDALNRTSKVDRIVNIEGNRII